jgi:hypothetical protein
MSTVGSNANHKFSSVAGKEDWVTVLKECPVSMDDVPPRRRQASRRLTL